MLGVEAGDGHACETSMSTSQDNKFQTADLILGGTRIAGLLSDTKQYHTHWIIATRPIELADKLMLWEPSCVGNHPSATKRILHSYLVKTFIAMQEITCSS